MLLIGSLMVLVGFIWCGKKLYQRFLHVMMQKEQKRIDSLHKELRDQFVTWDPHRLHIKLRWFLVAALLVSIVQESLVWILIATPIYVFGPLLWITWYRKKRFQTFQVQLLQFFPFVSSVLRAGHTLEKAIDQSCKNAPRPLRDEMLLVQKEMRLGQTFEQSLIHLHARMPDPNLRMAISAISISRKMGSNVAEAIDHIAVKIQEKEKLQSKLKALTAQGRMQAWVTVLMPFLLLAGLHVISPGYTDPLFETLYGKLALGYCVVSLAVGCFWIHAIATKEYL